MMANIVNVGASTLAALAAVLAVSAGAQQAAGPVSGGVDDYVCRFAGKCAPDQGRQEPSMAAPATKGFRLAAPSGSSSSTREVRPTPPVSVAASAPSSKRSRQRAAAARPIATRPVPAGTRADLSLSFTYNSDQLTDTARERARVFAAALMTPELRSKRFQIEGHTDSRGSRRVNVDLSRRRAQTVADYLVQQGVERERLRVRGYGPDRPLPRTSPTAEVNRRVEAVLLS